MIPGSLALDDLILDRRGNVGEGGEEPIVGALDAGRAGHLFVGGLGVRVGVVVRRELVERR